MRKLLFCFLTFTAFILVPLSAKEYYFDTKASLIKSRKSSKVQTIEDYNALIAQVKSYYKAHLPYNFVYGRFQEGGVDYEAKTVFIVFNTVIVMNANIISDVTTLTNILKNEPSVTDPATLAASIFPKASFTLNVSLVNGSGTILSTGEFHYTRSIKKDGLGKVWVNSMSLPISVSADKSGLFLRVNSIINFKRAAKISTMSKFEHLFIVKSGVEVVDTGATDLQEVVLRNNPYYEDIRKYLDYPTLFDLKDSVYKLTKVADISISDEDAAILIKNYGDKYDDEYFHLKSNEITINGKAVTRLKSNFNPFESCDFEYKFMEGSRCHFVYIGKTGAEIFRQFLRGDSRDYFTHPGLKNPDFNEIYDIMHSHNKAVHKLDYNKMQQHSDPLYADFYSLYMKTNEWISGTYPIIIPAYFNEGRAPKNKEP